MLASSAGIISNNSGIARIKGQRWKSCGNRTSAWEKSCWERHIKQECGTLKVLVTRLINEKLAFIKGGLGLVIELYPHLTYFR